MLSSVLTDPNKAAACVGLLRPQALPNGAEPDESWCLGQEKEFPDLVLKVALTSGGINKLEVYQRFKIPEVWFRRQNQLQIFVPGSSGNYEQSEGSQLLPSLNIPLIERCAAIRSWQQARQTFRAGLSGTK